MTSADYVKHFANMIPAESIPGNMDEHLNRAVRAGLEEFWGSYGWYFKMYEYSLDTSTSAEQYKLPDDFESFRLVKEQTSAQGRKLIYMEYEAFEMNVPKISFYGADTPQVCTVYRDIDTGYWMIRFFPQADGDTIKLAMHKNTPADCGEVPDRFQFALEACIAKHAYPYGSPGRVAATQDAEYSIRKCQILNKLNTGRNIHFSDGTDKQIETDRPWT